MNKIKELGLVIAILLFSCTSIEHDTGSAVAFADKWLVMDNFFSDTCFYLNNETHLTFIYEKDEEDVEEKDWEWEYIEPNLFIIDERELFVWPSLQKNCWDLEAYGLTATACNCHLDLP